MRAMLCILPVLFLLLGAGAPQMEENPQANLSALRIIEFNNASQPRETLYRDFFILEDLGEFLVAKPMASDEATLAKQSLSSKCVEVPAGAGTLYVISLKGVDSASLARDAKVLHSGEEIALVAAQEQTVNKLTRTVAHYGLEKGIRPLDLERVRYAKPFRAPQSCQKGSRAADARIQAMVDQVDAANLQNVVQDLQDMGERKATSGAFTAETYLVNSFNAIGGLS
ncbi:MAG: hypothetical protein KJ645_08120, partial [Planctomycetes bacterium]|nr:hypothetical protein [Planctomycetota bacterium]